MDELKIANVHAAPKLEKVVLNIGLGDIRSNRDAMTKALTDLSLIAGQKPITTKAKKSIAGFKLRQNEIVGARVTLRGTKMYEFLDRLITYVLPRLRDFQGLNRHGFDRHGNYSLGLREQTVFPEVPFESATTGRGIEITIVTRNANDEQAQALLTRLGLPFAKVKGAVNG